ncbi:hypothetical protein [Sorangium sp. So ce124]|uniref:hypothetical protein n=1 Tax=Sorangium sp. So ce124 TaxID=3133280 RepID=UPI003F63EA42
MGRQKSMVGVFFLIVLLLSVIPAQAQVISPHSTGYNVGGDSIFLGWIATTPRTEYPFDARWIQNHLEKISLRGTAIFSNQVKTHVDGGYYSYPMRAGDVLVISAVNRNTEQLHWFAVKFQGGVFVTLDSAGTTTVLQNGGRHEFAVATLGNAVISLRFRDPANAPSNVVEYYYLLQEYRR